MPRKQSEDVEVINEEVVEVKKDEKDLSVFNSNGGFVRVYSKELHGKDYADLAKGFAKKIGGSVK